MLKLTWNGYGRRLAMALYVSSTLFIASHIVNAFVAHELTAPPNDLSDSVPLDSSLDQGSSASSSPQPSQQQVQAIVASGIFALPKATVPGAGPGQHTAVSPLELAKKVSLLGTAIGGNSGGMAVFEDLSTKEQKIVRLHHSLLNIGELAAIEKDRALIRSGGQEEWITSAAATAMANPNRFPLPFPVSSDPEPPPQPVGKSASAKQILKRQDLAKWQPLVLRDHTQPRIERGKVVGLELNVAQDGFLGKIGLETNDMLVRVNGVEIPNRTFFVQTTLPQLKRENRITVDFIRNGERRTLSYIVQ